MKIGTVTVQPFTHHHVKFQFCMTSYALTIACVATRGRTPRSALKSKSLDSSNEPHDVIERLTAVCCSATNIYGRMRYVYGEVCVNVSTIKR